MSAYLQQLQHDPYDTSAGKSGAFSSRFPTLAFFCRLFNVVYHQGKNAERAPYSPQQWVEGSIAVLELLESCGLRIHVDGLHHSKNLEGPCVFIGNHMSTMETFLLPGLIQPHRPVTFVVKESLLTYPWFGAVLRSRNPITVGRTNPRHDLAAVMEGGVERLQTGTSIIVFPQSTRSSHIDSETFNSIGVKLAKKAGVPIIPIALCTDAWSTGSIVKDFGRIYPDRPVHFRFGEPLHVTGNGKAEHAAIFSFIKTQLEEWRLPAVR